MEMLTMIQLELGYTMWTFPEAALTGNCSSKYSFFTEIKRGVKNENEKKYWQE